jgi:hypothetical protein
MKPTIHRDLTRITLETFASELPESIISHADRILDGTEAEDNWWEPSRTLNWHFYRQHGSSIPRWTRFFGMWPTSEHIFAKRVKQLGKCVEKGEPEKYKYLGRILHHIQDMNTPSHVRPIYHDFVLHDHFESFMMDAEQMPEFQPDIPCTAAVSGDTLMTVYQEAAEATLRFIDSSNIAATVNGKPDALQLSVFWEASPSKGFGRFGKLHKIFKPKNRCRSMKASDGKTYVIEMEEFHRLNNAICGKAIADTFRALMCAANRYEL